MSFPKPKDRSFIHDEMFKIHSHAEIENDLNPNSIVYREEDVLKLIKLAIEKTYEHLKENLECDWEYSNPYDPLGGGSCVIEYEKLPVEKILKEFKLL